MTTTIAPAIGEAPTYLAGGVGAAPGYSAISVRRMMFADSIQEGTISDQSFEPSQRAAGANLSVDLAANSGDGFVVQGDAVGSQGLYHVARHSAVINETLTPADATNPRVDSLILEIKDDTHDGSALNLARTRVLTGTPTGGATLTNRSGAVALPASAVLLADVLVGAGVTSVDNTKIRDRRPWAKGLFRTFSVAGPYSAFSSASPLLIDAVNLQPREECSGVPLRLTMQASLFGNATVTPTLGFMVDGTWQGSESFFTLSNTEAAAPRWTTVLIPAAGSHLFGPAATVNAPSFDVYANSGPHIKFTLEEIVRPNRANNVVTSG